MSATVETVAVEVVVREKKPTLPAKYTKNLVFGYWLIEKLHHQGLLSESTPAYELLQLFADVPTQISYMDEGFFEELSSLTKDMKAKIRAFHKPVKASTKKTAATGEDAPAKKRGRKKAVVIPPVLDEQSQIIADLVETANPTKKQSAIDAVRSLLNSEESTIPTPKTKKNTNKKNTPTAPVVTVTVTENETATVTGEEPKAVVPTPKTKKTTNNKTPASETVTETVNETVTGEEPKVVVPTPKNKKTTNKKTPPAETVTVTGEEPKAVVTTPKNKKNTNKKSAPAVIVEKPKAHIPLEEGEEPEPEPEQDQQEQDEIEASPFVFNQQHFLIDNDNNLYHPSSFIILGYFDPIKQIISLN